MKIKSTRKTLAGIVLLVVLFLIASARNRGARRSDFSSLSPLPYPSGKTYALSLIDDPDGGSLDLTVPVYDFLDSLQIKVTKCVWMFPAQDPSADWGEARYSMADPAYRAFALKLAREGHELAFHGASAGNDTRPTIEAALEEFKKTFGSYPRMNADHSKNLENLYFGQKRFTHAPFQWLYRLFDSKRYQGEDKESTYFWGDLARDKIRYHRGFYFSGLDTLAQNPSMPYFNPRKPYVRFWYSVTDGYDAAMFLSRLSPRAAAALKKRMGASILYTHFGYGFYDPQTHELNPRFKEILTRLAQDPDLWIAPASDLLDRLDRFDDVAFTARRNSWTIRNRGPLELRDVTIVDRDGRLGPLKCVSGQRLTQVKPGVYRIERLAPASLAVLTDAEHAAHLNDEDDNIPGGEQTLIRLEWLWRAVETRL